MSLEDIREKKHGKGIYIIIGLLLVGMAGFGTSEFGTGANSGQATILTAGDAEISQIEYQNTLQSIQQRNPDMKPDDAQKLTLSTLQQRVALSHYLNQYPLAASNQEMDRLISSNPAFFDNGKFSDAAFRRVTRVAPEVYRKSLSKDIAIQSLQQTIAETGIISQAEVKPYLALSQLSRDILVAKVARSQFTNTANDKEVQTYYDKNKNRYMTDEKLSIEYIDLNPSDIAAKITVSDAEILAAAQPARKAKYHVFSDEKAAKAAYEKHQAGSDIKTLLSTLGETIEDSGDLGEIASIATAGALLPQPAIDAIYALKKVGDLTAPIVIDDTVYLFELIEKGSIAISDTEKKTAKTNLQALKAVPKIAELNETLNTAVFESQSPTLESIAAATGLAVAQESNLSSNTGQGILAIPELLTAIQNSDKRVNKLQEPVTIGERVIIYRLTTIAPPLQEPLTAVKTQVEQAVIAEKTDEELNKATEQLVEEAKKDSLITAANAANYPTQTLESFSGNVDNDALLDPFAAMLIARQLPKLGDKNATAINSPIGDAYVYVTTDIRLNTNDTNTVDGQEVASALSGQVGQLELSRFIQSITEQSDIRLNSSLLTK